MSKKIDRAYSNSGISPNSGISRDDLSKGAAILAVKVAERIKEEAQYAIPAAREAASHAAKEFAKKFVGVYERKKREQ